MQFSRISEQVFVTFQGDLMNNFQGDLMKIFQGDFMNIFQGEFMNFFFHFVNIFQSDSNRKLRSWTNANRTLQAHNRCSFRDSELETTEDNCLSAA